MSIWWKIGGVALLCGALYFLVKLYGGTEYRRGKADSNSEWSAQVIAAEKDKLLAYQQGVLSVGTAETTYHETVRDRLVPITNTVVERASKYEQTADGASVCLGNDRVLGLEQTRRALFPTVENTASGDSGAVVPPSK